MVSYPSPVQGRDPKPADDLPHHLKKSKGDRRYLMPPSDHCASSGAQPPLLFALPFLLFFQHCGELGVT